MRRWRERANLFRLPASGMLLSLLITGCGYSQTPIGVLTVTASSVTATAGLIFVGPYQAGTPYVAADVVTFQGSAYVGLMASTSIPPVGQTASAAAWGLLVAAGDTGPRGPAGPQGPAGAEGPSGARGAAGARGPTGAQGPAGPQGATGALGLTGATGAQGAQGLPGSQGTTGAMGAQGPPGPAGATGPTGPQGPVGPQGASGTLSSGNSSPLSGHTIGVLGDSISSLYGNQWQNVVLARTGATLSYQDARPGRRFSDAFECYGATVPGSPLGTYQVLANCGYSFQTSTVGDSLAQNLAGTEMLLLRLGTNDQYVPLGALGDATNAGTLYGNMRWVVETLLTAKPTIRLVLITPELNHFASIASIEAVVNAEVAYGGSMGIPVLNLYTTSGNNAITNTVYTRDGTHPSDWAFVHVDGPAIAQFVQQWF